MLLVYRYFTHLCGDWLCAGSICLKRGLKWNRVTKITQIRPFRKTPWFMLFPGQIICDFQRNEHKTDNFGFVDWNSIWYFLMPPYIWNRNLKNLKFCVIFVTQRWKLQHALIKKSTNLIYTKVYTTRIMMPYVKFASQSW
jgi:hypothetical protein